MAAILAKILDGEITLGDLEVISQVDSKEDVSSEQQKPKQPNLAELAPFLLNYLREKTSHHLTPRQNAALTPKKTPVSQTKGIKPATEQSQHGTKNSSRGNLFPSQKTPSPSPVTPLSQTRRDKFQEQCSSPSSSPRLRRKSPKVQANERERVSPLVAQPRINIDDPEDFPPVGCNSKKSTPSRRITPTQVRNDGKKGKSSPLFTSSPFASGQPVLDSHGSPASLQEERNMLKLMRSKKKKGGDSPWGNRNSPSPQTGVRSPPSHVLGDFIVTPKQTTTSNNSWQSNHCTTRNSLLSSPSPYKDINENSSPDIFVTNDFSQQHVEQQTCQEKPQFVQVDKGKVDSQDKLDALAKIYSKCITSNLVPNVTAEVYFVVQLLTARGIAPDSNQNKKNTREGKMEDQNILYSIHNCAYLAVAVLQDIQRLILLLDKDTLRLLADNPRVADFSPRLKETFLQQYKSYSAIKVSVLNHIKSPLGGVPFSVERDNKQNFPTDRAFHNFRKQRDVFYELVREWEDCNTVAGWNMEDNMGDRIRALVNQKPELANYSHFARLFKSQLLQMCEEERNGSNLRSSSMLSNLQKSNPEKFQRLQERFVTPSSSLGPCPSPSFTNVQEFFKGFILSAASHSFNQHLIDLLIVTITEMNDKEFPLTDLEEGSEKELSIQNQELKQEFSSCLMKIRILAKFLGFLLFKPYYGTETTSQVVVTETLKLRNRIPVHFDVLGHFKKAWYRGRLVLTIPWAAEYLSMMDPLAPLLDYFSETLHWLSRTYRELAVFPKPDFNHSKLLLMSCLGWLFEISAIPASFFFKSLAERKTSVDCETQLKNSDLKVNLDSSGLVDQAILYSCCPYLGEIRCVLVEAAAGMTGRAGPVKKITPVSADETTRISSSQKQLQLQLEENFFRIQPDFLKRMSDFTVERLCSNIISHVKGSIIPSLLDKGVQRIQQFLENEFSSNVNNDQAKEKCRPHVLKIIHAVTDDGVKTAVETIESSKKKSLSAFESLCPQDMNRKVITTAANITARLVKEKTTDWINMSFPNIMEEELFAQFNKIANSILYSKSKEQQNAVASSTRDGHSEEEITGKECEIKTKCHVPGGISGQNINPVMKIKALQAALSEQSMLLAQQSTNEETHQVVDALCAVESLLFEEAQSYTKEITMIGQITVELAFILVCRAAYGINFVSTHCTTKDCEILDKLTKLWTQLKDKQVPVPFARLLSVPHINLIMTIENREVIWASVEALFFFLVQKQLVYTYEVEQWYIDALGSARDETRIYCIEEWEELAKECNDLHQCTSDVILQSEFKLIRRTARESCLNGCWSCLTADYKETAVEIGKACCSLVLAYQETREIAGPKDVLLKTATPGEFSLLLSILTQRFSRSASLSTVLAECIKNVPGVIAMPGDCDLNERVAPCS